ncbi:MAG: accessory factor UbiK family protein [Candidatus Polarisedimenticolaceae bacterium]|nr:accessory factor UbiK family protein [Candidatus Polarisedimenticolaceae bacterium]
MIDAKLLDDLAAQLAGSVPSGIQLLQDDLKRNLRATLEANLSKLDLVTRNDFDVQSAVLARTREKLEKLEKDVAELEQTLSGTATNK